MKLVYRTQTVGKGEDFYCQAGHQAARKLRRVARTRRTGQGPQYA